MSDKPLSSPIFVNSESDDITALRLAFAELEETVNQICPNGRRKSIALTKIEAASMFAIKSAYEKNG